MMTRLFVLLCAIILAANFIDGAYQYKLSKSALNSLSNRIPTATAAGAANGGGQGQGEYYVPSYYSNRLPGQVQQSQQQAPSYQELLLAENLAAEQAFAEEAAAAAAAQQQQPQYFPSIVRPSISLNGPDRLSKYKQREHQSETEDETGISVSQDNDNTSPVINTELRRWLANIRALQPVVDDRLDALGDYIRAAGRQYQAQMQQQRAETADQDYYTKNAAPRGFEDPRIQQQQQQQLQQLLNPPKQASSSKQISRLSPYAAEAMMDTNSYEDLQEATAGTRQRGAPAVFEEKKRAEEERSVVTHETGESSVRSEPKARRKLVDQEQSPASLLATSRNLVHSPKALYQDKQSSSGSSSSSPSSTSTLLSSLSDVYFVAIVACVSSVAIFSVIGAGYCFYKVQQSNKAAIDVDFPTYGIIGPASRAGGTGSEEKDVEGVKSSTGSTGTGGGSVSCGGAKCSSPPADRKLAQSAQMYHYHHQKQQMISNEKHANTPRHNAAHLANNSDVESDEENEDGEYTVYECPGLAPTGEMEVKNPLFADDLTPMSSPSVNATGAATGATTKTESPKTATVSTSGSSSKTPENPAAKKSETDK